jgi:diguanylate cyclase (GGDEF)-like protein/PAS domain S-box-containing protein
MGNIDLSTLLSNLPGMAYRCRNDADWTMEFISQGCQALTGYSPEDLIESQRISFADLIHPDDRKSVWANVQQALSEGCPFQLIYRIRMRDGVEKWVWEQGRGIWSADGELIALEGLIMDITERRRAEEALRQSEERYRTLAEVSPDMIFMIDEEYRVLYLNRLAASQFGIAVDQSSLASPDIQAALIGRPLSELFPPAINARQQAAIRQVFVSDQMLSSENYTEFPGRHVWLNTWLVPIHDDRGRVISVLGVSRDITERKQAEQVLARRAEEMAALYDTSLEINSQVDLEQLLYAVVERAARLIQTPIGGMYLFSPDGNSLRLSVGYHMPPQYMGRTLRIGEGVAGRVVESGVPLSVDDHRAWEEGSPLFRDGPFRRVLGIPLRTSNGTIGAITLSDDQKTGDFSQDDIRLVSLFADQAAIAVEKARLIESERQRRLELARANALVETLSHVSTYLSAALDEQQVMEIVGEQLKKLGLTIQIALFEPLAKPGEQQLVVQYTSLEDQVLAEVERMLGITLKGSRVPMHAWPIDRMIQTRQAMTVNDVLSYLLAILPAEPPHLVRTMMEEAHLEADTPVVYLPLTARDQPLGMMAMWGINLRTDDLAAYLVFATQVATALHNARLYNRVQTLSLHDDLTGLYNRRGFFMLAEQQMKLVQREVYSRGRSRRSRLQKRPRLEPQMMLVFLDLDGLKAINDTLGHQEGDRALVEAANLLRATFRKSDILARIGGDEFAVLALDNPPSDTGHKDHGGRGSDKAGDEVAAIILRLAQHIEQANQQPERAYRLSLSYGFAAWSPHNPESLDALLARADEQMYAHKREKKC